MKPAISPPKRARMIKVKCLECKTEFETTFHVQNCCTMKGQGRNCNEIWAKKKAQKSK